MTPTRDQVLTAFDRLNVWSRGSERAPHKPLLVLYALGRLSQGESGPVSFREVGPVLTDLLKEFGPSRTSYHPEYPFWRLQNDGIWVVEGAERLRRRTAQTDIPKRELLDNDIHAHFTDEVTAALHHDPSLIADTALRLLDAHFPPSLHQDILDAVGLDLHQTETVTRKKRDPGFRLRVLTAYEYSCAVCGFDVRLGNQPLALEAAHIKWHQAGGPDRESNGLALCSLHHKAFDLGAFTIEPGRRLLVSEHANGRQGLDEFLLRHHGRSVRPPLREEYSPAEAFLAWHEKQVFKTPARFVTQAG